MELPPWLVNSKLQFLACEAHHSSSVLCTPSLFTLCPAVTLSGLISASGTLPQGTQSGPHSFRTIKSACHLLGRLPKAAAQKHGFLYSLYSMNEVERSAAPAPFLHFLHFALELSMGKPIDIKA